MEQDKEELFKLINKWLDNEKARIEKEKTIIKWVVLAVAVFACIALIAATPDENTVTQTQTTTEERGK